MNPKLKTKLQKLAQLETWDDAEDFCPCDFCGGNYDDSYYGGQSDGKTKLAREILEEFDEED